MRTILSAILILFVAAVAAAQYNYPPNENMKPFMMNGMLYMPDGHAYKNGVEVAPYQFSYRYSVGENGPSVRDVLAMGGRILVEIERQHGVREWMDAQSNIAQQFFNQRIQDINRSYERYSVQLNYSALNIQRNAENNKQYVMQVVAGTGPDGRSVYTSSSENEETLVRSEEAIDEHVRARDTQRPREYNFKSGAYFKGELQPIWQTLNSSRPVLSSQKEAKEIGLNAIVESDRSYAEGDTQSAEFYKKVGVAMADLALGLTPGVGLVKDVYEAVSGRSVLTGDLLGATDRILAMVGVITLGFGDDILKGVRSVQKIVEATEGAAKITTTVRNSLGVIREVKVVRYAGETVNEAMSKQYKNFQKIWGEGSAVYKFSTSRPMRAWVVHGEAAEKLGAFSMRENPMRLLEKMSLEDAQKYLRDIYAIPPGNPISHISEIVVPTGETMLIGKAGENAWGTGGGVQFVTTFKEGVPLKWRIGNVIDFK
jgi:hypothetical protein